MRKNLFRQPGPPQSAVHQQRTPRLGILRSAQADDTDNGRERTDHSRRAAGVYAPKLKQMTSGADGRGVAAVGRYGCHCARLRPPTGRARMGLAENIQMHAQWSHISRPSAGISSGATLVILAIQLPDGVAQAVVLGDASPAALSVSMAGVAAWIVTQIVTPRRILGAYAA